MTTRAISHPLPPPPDLGGVLEGVKGSLGFAMKRVLLGMKDIKIAAINALIPHRVSRGRTESAEKTGVFRSASRQTTQLTAVTVYPALRKSSTSPSEPGKCMAPTAMKTLPLANIGPACAAITLLRLVIMVCSKAA